MKISYNWLQDFIEISESPEELSEVLTQTGLEVEGLEKVEKVKGGLNGLVVGEVIECNQHPNADKLKITKVDTGGEDLLDIVCGAPNVAKGQKVVVAPVDTTIYPTNGEPFKIRKAKIRGEVSEGMICAEDEIGLGTAHEGVIVLDTDKPNGSPVADLFEIENDYVFEIGLTPNRGDAASHLGSARDLKAFYRRSITMPETGEFKIKEEHPVKVTVENTDACPRYTGVTIRDIKIGPSPEWLQWRLRSIGLEPISNIVDITNYTLHGLGQPLHAFDADEITGGEVIVKTLPSGSLFTTLDDVKRELHEEDLMICDGQSNGMCIAGVFGGIKSGVKETTKNIFLESACFSQDYIRATALRHGLNTDASFRFERGTDPEMTAYALKFATKLILELAGGYVASEIIDVYPEKVEPARIPTKFNTFDRLIGKKLPHKEIVEILGELDIQCEDISKENFTAIVPAYRSEVTREADLVEEVLRIHGINNIDIDESFSTGYLAEFQEVEPYKLQEELSYYLAGKGFREILTNSITNLKYENDLSLGKGHIIELLNKSSEDLGILKPSPVYTGLESVVYNLNRKKNNLRFFEFCQSYSHLGDEYTETAKMCLYLTGNESEESWMTDPVSISFQHLSGSCYDLLRKVGIPKYEISEIKDSSHFEYGLEIKINKMLIASFGKLKTEIASYFNMTQDVFYAEFEWDQILDNGSRNFMFRDLPKYPEVRRDLSLVLDQNISYKEIEEISFNSEKKLLNRMNVFSIYEGDRIEAGKKAYAIAFYLQDRERTMTDKQIDKVMRNLMGKFETELSAIIRK